MDSNILKYNLLNSFEKKEVKDFIDFLFSRKKDALNQEPSDYKKKILSVSTWSDQDLEVFDESKKMFNQLPPATW